MQKIEAVLYYDQTLDKASGLRTEEACAPVHPRFSKADRASNILHFAIESTRVMA